MNEKKDKGLRIGTFITYCPNCGSSGLICVDLANIFNCGFCGKQFSISSIPKRR